MSFSKLMSRVLLSCLFLWSISIAGNIISKDAKAAEQQNEQTTDDAGPLSLDGKQRENTDFNPNSGDPVFNNKETKSAVLGFSEGSEKNPNQVISDYYNTDNNDDTESKNLDILPYQKGTNVDNNVEKSAFRSGTIVESGNTVNNTNSVNPISIEGTEVQREGSVIEGTVNPINLNTEKPAFRSGSTIEVESNTIINTGNNESIAIHGTELNKTVEGNVIEGALNTPSDLNTEKPAFRTGSTIEVEYNNTITNTGNDLPINIEGSVIEGTVNPINNLNTEKTVFRSGTIVEGTVSNVGENTNMDVNPIGIEVEESELKSNIKKPSKKALAFKQGLISADNNSRDRDCPDGYVDDCSGDGDCCSASWIGDGYGDCEDQAYGCDLTCYDNDGGDCGPVGCTDDEFTCGDGSCIPGSWECDNYNDCADGSDEANCASDGCADDQFDCGDGTCIYDFWECDGWVDCADGSDEADCAAGCPDGYFDCYGDGTECIPGSYYCDGSSEYCNASWGPDCSNGADEGLEQCGYEDQCSTAEVVYSGTMTYDWYCSGSYGTGNLTLYDDGSADLDGYAGYWGNHDGVSLDAGLCEANDIDAGMFFAFNNYASVYTWGSDGCGSHDDQGYNGVNADGTTSFLNDDPSSCYGSDEPEGCPDGYVEDCEIEGQCVPASWIGDGFCDDGSWGAYLNCDAYDNDGGDCDVAPECPEGTFDCLGDGTECIPASYYCDGSDEFCNAGWPADCSNGADEGLEQCGYEDECPACDEGYVEDCSGDGDCCAASWIGDGFGDCEDQAYGCDLTCYGDDGGDCTEDDGGDAELILQANMTYDWYCSGSWGTATVEFYDDGTATLDGSYPGTWGYGDFTTFGDGLCAGGDLDVGYWFEFDNYATRYSWAQTGCGYHDDIGYNGDTNVDGVTMLIDYVADTDACYGSGEPEGCPDGYVEDCEIEGQCVPASWIGDGFCDDGTYGAYLNCDAYGNDGGDCDVAPECPEGTFDCLGDGTECIPASYYCDGSDEFCNASWPADCSNGADEGLEQCGYEDECEEEPEPCPDGYVDDCSGDGDCCPASWIGDGFEDCEDQAFGCDLTCYDEDGGDCADTGANLIWTATMSYDWYCTGSYGTGTLNFYDDGTADLDGYPGYWFQNADTYDMPSGLCEGGEYTPTVIFNFANYTTSYAWETEGNGYPSDAGCGIHDDYGYNGPSVDGTSSLNVADPSVCYGDDEPDGCPEGTLEDCSGDGDCIPESWLGDGWCDGEDQQYGADLSCYDNDNGDCDTGAECPEGTFDCLGDGTECIPESWYCDGSEEFCNASWPADCSNGADEGLEQCGYEDECEEEPEPCADGFVDDCSGDGDCCPESWIGDGFSDCEDQGFGCDLTCYDNDGGDCYECADDGLVECNDGSCAPEGECPEECPEGYIDDCSGDGDCCPVSWIGDGFEDCEDQAYGCDLTCYENDGGDCYSCADDGLVECWDGSCAASEDDCPDVPEAIAQYNFTYDWYCTGSPGSSVVDLYSDGTCMIGGYYTGTWGYGNGEEAGFADGLCPGSIQEDDFWFMFDNYATQYRYDMSDDLSSGVGVHDDMGYNGPWTADGETFCDRIGDDVGCPDGYVDDCSGDGDCCPESWIGDGFEDCEDQAFGCDLTCYANDGGDCSGDVEDDIYSEADMMANGGTYTFTYDWYCTGSPGTATVTLLWDGESTCDFFNPCPALIDGYDGGWGVNAGGGSVPYDDGLCTGLDLDWDFGFGFANYATAYSYDLDVADDGSLFGGGVHDDYYYNGQWNVDGTSSIAALDVPDEGCPDGYVEDCVDDDCCPESWIGDGFEDCEDQAYGCDLTCYDNDGGDCTPDTELGDINGDGALDVIDVVLMVNAIIDGEGLDNGDMNGDGSLDVIDVVILVNAIINGEGRAMDAESATVIETANSLTVKGDGYIGGIQMTLSHDNGFELNLTDAAMVAEYKTSGTNTILVVVEPEEELIFTSNASFEIVDMIIANSHEEIEVNTIGEFGLSAAYPNPFNPSTTVTLHVPSADYVSVKVYNLVGQVVSVLADGMMDANTYTLTWNASNMSSGVYLISAESGSGVDIQKVLLVK